MTDENRSVFQNYLWVNVYTESESFVTELVSLLPTSAKVGKCKHLPINSFETLNGFRQWVRPIH